MKVNGVTVKVGMKFRSLWDWFGSRDQGVIYTITEIRDNKLYFIGKNNGHNYTNRFDQIEILQTKINPNFCEYTKKELEINNKMC